jgi:hypothetical protein
MIPCVSIAQRYTTFGVQVFKLTNIGAKLSKNLMKIGLMHNTFHTP